ncbi:TRAP transporter large permease subunit [Chelativorans sp. SCAU2101]|uniref:TRAP transporter large permease protein n=1 Tax=Chelativorans petroleitrophicus TaxID=2975484 RepID=A0A9X2X533_9HYPH|nr:TRAP transporter large permease subunit [Chelativorans petroleitrophicus]MCT8989217.1 TRAP transporter large permease subunit [Chelativorans petroleitrophicus]
MLIVAIAFLILLLMGMPVAFAIGISGALFFLQHPELPFTIPVQVTVSQTQNFALLAVPLFIMAGNFMNRSGITERLLELASVLTGRMTGGLAQVSLALSALMGGVSGSAIADAAMQARMLGQEMVKRGFTLGFASAVLSFGAVLTPTIPPGIGMILYGTIGQVSIGRLFAAGFVPAILLWIGLSATVWLTAKRRGYKPEREKRPTLRETAHAFTGGIWAILFPVFLLLGLRTGVFTPSEIGAFAVVYAIFIGVLIYRKMKTRAFLEALEGSLSDVGSVMFLIALSAIFSYGIVLERVPEVVSGLILGITQDLEGVMVLIALFTLAAGFFIDATVLIIMLTPIFLPLIRQLGGDPVHFGMIFLVAATIGNFTPPVGAAMYAVCSILKCPIGAYTRESIPLFAAVAVITLFLVFVPEAVLFLPNLIFG